MYIKPVNDEVKMSSGYYVSSDDTDESVPEDWEAQNRGKKASSVCTCAHVCVGCKRMCRKGF